MNLLFKILDTSHCWNDLYQQLIKYNTKLDKTAGKIFEKFCKYYYLSELSLKLEYKHVWSFREIPDNIRKRLNLSKIDHGVDLVLEDNEGKLSVVQCKFKNNQNSSICWSKDKLANLFAEGDQADYYIVFTNASKLDRHSLNKKSTQLKLVTVGNLLAISEATINNIKNLIQSKPIVAEPLKKPRPYQKIAIRAVLKEFKKMIWGN